MEEFGDFAAKHAPEMADAFEKACKKVNEARERNASHKEVSDLQWEAVQWIERICDAVPEARDLLPPMASIALGVIDGELPSKARH